MVSEADLRRELQKILGFDVSSLPMNSTKSALSDRLDPENVGNVVQSESDEIQSTSQISGSPSESSLSKQKGASPHPTGPSLMLSDPSIPKSTYESSSKPTTGQLPNIPKDMLIGRTHTILPPQSARSYQIAGSHYRKHKIQPVEYIIANNLSFLAGNIIKYATRYKDKGGAEDIRKIIHYSELILEFEYKNEEPKT